MDGTVVELNALTDTDGARAEDDDFLLVGQAGSVLACVGRIEVSDVLARM